MAYNSRVTILKVRFEMDSPKVRREFRFRICRKGVANKRFHLNFIRTKRH